MAWLSGDDARGCVQLATDAIGHHRLFPGTTEEAMAVGQSRTDAGPSRRLTRPNSRLLELRAPGTATSGRSAAISPRLCTASRSEEHTSELQSLMRISYAVFCLKKHINKKEHKKNSNTNTKHINNT